MEKLAEETGGYLERKKNLEEKRNTDYDFPPPLYVGGK